VLIVGDRRIRTLNRRWLGHDRATDVISFPMDEDGYLGDIVISAVRARVQARENKVPLANEIERLVVHGILHLVGYDDTRPRLAARMWKKQEELLRC
jgi:probable rRNA maturation factor